jgi:predicted metal-dependent phosphoesterase TrpH
VLCDFHLHTHHSDGVIPPARLLAMVRHAGIEHFAVTDHDSLAGFAAMRGAAGLVAGVEMTAGLEGREIHLIGLGIDPDHQPFIAQLAGIRATRLERLAVLAVRLPATVGRGVTLADLQADRDYAHVEAFGRLHLAKALVKRGGVASIQAAFADHLGDDYTVDAGLPPYPHPRDCCKAIQDAGGVAILAHPGIYGSAARVAALLDLGCDGLELDHPNLSSALASELRALASGRGLLASSGSDLHFPGSRKPGAWSLAGDGHAALLRRLGLAA